MLFETYPDTGFKNPGPGDHPASAYASFEQAMDNLLTSLEPRLVLQNQDPTTPPQRP